MRYIYTVVIILVFLCSCIKQKHNAQIDNIKISLQEMPQIDADSIIENIKIVQLETNENCLIGHIDKIKIYGDKVFILERKAGNILVYNNSGKFLYKISKHGKGYGEYVLLTDFDVEPNSGDIYILDGMTGKLLVFRENEFIKDFNSEVGSNYMNICFLGNNRIVFENRICQAKVEMKYHLFVTDESMKILNKEIPYEKGASLVMAPVSPFSKYDDGISYLPIYNDTIFCIKNGHAIPKYKLDFGKNWIDEEYLYSKNIDQMSFIQDLEKSNSIYFLNTIESNGHIFIYFTYKDKKFAYLYDKDTKKGAFIKNYMENGCGNNGLPVVPDGDLFVGMVNPSELINVKEKELQKGYPDLKGSINNNPFLSYLKFKKIK